MPADAPASDGAGRLLSRVELEGPDPYTLTGRLLAWAAVAARDGGLAGAGVLGPVQAFGLAKLAAACADLGLAEPPAPGT